MTTLTRRKAITALAAVPAAVAIGSSIPAALSAPVETDAELLRVGSKCLEHARLVARLRRRSKAAYERVWSIENRFPQWSFMRVWRGASPMIDEAVCQLIRLEIRDG